MDPFEKIPVELHENLLRFFDAKESVNVLSLVSKSWYDIVASSSSCMKKIKLNLKSKRKTDFAERIETLRWMSRSNGRRYQHLQINCLLDEAVSHEVWLFLDSLCGSVETINIRSMKLNEKLKNISLPLLSLLKVMFIPREAMDLLLTSSSSFKTLILWNEFPLCYDNIDYTPSDSTIASIREFATRNQMLEVLEMQGRPHYLAFFQGDICDSVTFTLKELVVKVEMSPEKIPTDHEENFSKFLSHQAKSLNHVYVDSCSTRIIKQVFNELPAVTFIRFDIELRDPNRFDIKELSLVPNEKVTQLELSYIKLFDEVKDFFELVPNVEEILVAHINPLLLRYAIKEMTKLKQIVYRYDDCAGGCESAFENMRREDPENVKSLKLVICNDFL